MSLGWISLHRKILDNPILSRGKTYSRFEGGLNTATSRRDISDNELSSASNVVVDELGVIKSCGKFLDIHLITWMKTLELLLYKLDMGCFKPDLIMTLAITTHLQ